MKLPLEEWFLLGVETLRLLELLLDPRLMLPLLEEEGLVVVVEGLLVDDCGRTYSELERG